MRYKFNPEARNRYEYAKKEAKKMVKWDKRMARLNKIPLSQIPRTEWAQNP